MEKKKINEHIGKVCQEYRLKNNLTQNQVAELTGLEPRHISQIERGFSKGSIDTLLKLCNAYKITPDIILYDLLDEETKKSVSESKPLRNGLAKLSIYHKLCYRNIIISVLLFLYYKMKPHFHDPAIRCVL